MRLTLKELPHIDDMEWPIEAADCPVRFVSGDRDALWAEDELGRTWLKESGDDRWHRTLRLEMNYAPKPP